MRKKVRWFSTNTKQYYCIAYCPEHGMHQGKIRMKKTKSEGVFVIRVIRRANMEDYSKIVRKKQEIRKKRNAKKNKETGTE